ncbi:MAG: oligosaccharide flippase family protein [Anaerolineae bacterium]
MFRTIHRRDLLAALLLLILPLLLFWPVTVGPKTLLPVDNLFAFEPWRSFAQELGVGIPQNQLLSDLILENYVWKTFILESIGQGQIPLWNPHIFAGQPFLANGQHSALYPFSLLFYLLPLSKAYGWFTVLQLWLAGAFTYIFLRVLGARRLGALLAGITYALSGFFIARVVFTMILAAAVWLPLILAMIEIVIRKQAEKGRAAYSPIPYIVAGAAALGMQVLAGHPEITYYVLLVSGYYALVRLIVLWRGQGEARPALRLAGWLLAMVIIGLGLGAVQWLPLVEAVTHNFRAGSVTLAEVRSWALPYRRIITFLLPDFFGNPSHHGVWDVVTRQWQPLGLNAHGQTNPLCAGCTGWDTKTSVEAGAYPGLLPWLLAGLAVLAAVFPLGKRAPTPAKILSRRTPVWIFAALAVLSLLFAFGTPLYAVLFYGLPGWNQLHTPFRWIYPFTLSLAVLAGLGATALERLTGTGNPEPEAPRPGWLPRLLRPGSWLLIGGGLLGLLVLALALLVPEPFIRLGQMVLDRSGLAQNAFADGRQFFSYQWPVFLKFFLFVLGGGAVLRLAWCPIYLPRRLGGLPVWQPLAVLVVALDLILAGAGFNPAVERRLLDFTPPVARWLQAQQTDDPLFRLTSFDAPAGRGNKVFLANAGMPLGLYDVRGYDSIIPAQYLRFMQLIQPNNDWLFNRVGPLYAPGYEALDSALLDLLGVRYVLTTETIDNPGYELAYDREIKVYENLDALPRAFVVNQAQVGLDDFDLELRSLDPRRTVILDGETSGRGRDLTGAEAGAATVYASGPPVAITGYTPNEVTVLVRQQQAGWLVLADTYFPGWRAFAQRSDWDQETEITIHRADGNFRAVFVPPGQWRIRFKYAPRSFQLGLYTSFLAGTALFLLTAYWTWGRLYREDPGDSPIKRIAKNSLAPMALALLNRVIDFVFALLMLRVLAPEGVGRYAFAVSFITFFEIVSRFGLGTLLTREVARDHAGGNRYLSNVVLLRGLLWLLALPAMAAIAGLYVLFGDLTFDVVITIAIFSVGLLLSNAADALSSLFYAYEKAEYPAFISTVTTLTRMALGGLVLLLGGGIIGLAGVSVVGNLLTVTALGLILLRKIFRPQREVDFGLQRTMLHESLPLMINHLLATVFFRIDVFILKPARGDEAVGFYNAAYKYVDGINIIPQYFTLAIFPLMSRYARDSRESLLRAYVLSLRLLQMLALPVAVGTPFIARELILILGGPQFLPDSAIVLQLLIGFLPFSFINQVTQYVLIAIDQQRFLTRAFIIGVVFNLVTNLIFIPLYGYRAAAVTTVLSEWALLIPFYYAVRKNLGAVPWLDVVWRPALAATAMAAALWLWRDSSAWVLVPLAAAIYFGALALVGGFRQPDMDLIWRALPLDKVRARLPARFEPGYRNFPPSGGSQG